MERLAFRVKKKKKEDKHKQENLVSTMVDMKAI